MISTCCIYILHYTEKKRTRCSVLCQPELSALPCNEKELQGLTLDCKVSFLRQNLWNTSKNKRVFYGHYITAAHEKHWPIFLHTVTCSTVAGREEARGGGRTPLPQCAMAGGAGRGKKIELSLRDFIISQRLKRAEQPNSEHLNLLGLLRWHFKRDLPDAENMSEYKTSQFQAFYSSRARPGRACWCLSGATISI